MVVAAGGAHIGSIEIIGEEIAFKGIGYKMMGQVNVVLTGQHYLNEGGSFTLTMGILAEDPIKERLHAKYS